MEGYQVRKLAFLAIFVGLFVLVAMLFYPFLTVIIWSSLFYAFLSPLFKKLTTRKDGTERAGFVRTAAAAVLALGGVLLIAVPAAFLGIAVAKQMGQIIKETLLAVEQNPASLGLGPEGPLASFLSTVTGGSIDIGAPSGGLRYFLSSRANEILGFSGRLLKDLAGILVNLIFMVFTIFFLLVDGKHLAEVFIDAIPIERSYTTIFLQKFKDMGKHLVTGYFLVAILIAVVVFALCLVFSIKGGLVIGTLTAIGSFIPFVGASMVLVPVAASRFISGDLAGALLFLAVAAGLVWTIDNFVRPFFLRDRLKIHPLLIFFSILGGLVVFRFNGIVLGPLILILFFTALDFFKRAYDMPTGPGRRITDCVEHEEGESGSD